VFSSRNVWLHVFFLEIKCKKFSFHVDVVCYSYRLHLCEGSQDIYKISVLPVSRRVRAFAGKEYLGILHVCSFVYN
jgi:hypothetical protein